MIMALGHFYEGTAIYTQYIQSDQCICINFTFTYQMACWLLEFTFHCTLCTETELKYSVMKCGYIQILISSAA
jgi:hypothetical protein